MSKYSVTHPARRQKSRQAALPLNLRQSIDIAIWLEENIADPLLISLARVVRRRIEQQIPLDNDRGLPQ